MIEKDSESGEAGHSVCSTGVSPADSTSAVIGPAGTPALQTRLPEMEHSITICYSALVHCNRGLWTGLSLNEFSHFAGFRNLELFFQFAENVFQLLSLFHLDRDNRCIQCESLLFEEYK